MANLPRLRSSHANIHAAIESLPASMYNWSRFGHLCIRQLISTTDCFPHSSLLAVLPPTSQPDTTNSHACIVRLLLTHTRSPILCFTVLPTMRTSSGPTPFFPPRRERRCLEPSTMVPLSGCLVCLVPVNLPLLPTSRSSFLPRYGIRICLSRTLFALFIYVYYIYVNTFSFSLSDMCSSPTSPLICTYTESHPSCYRPNHLPIYIYIYMHSHITYRVSIATVSMVTTFVSV